MNTGKTDLLCVLKENENFDPIFSWGQEIEPQFKARLDAIQIPSPFSFNFQCSIFSELGFLCIAMQRIN